MLNVSDVKSNSVMF